MPCNSDYLNQTDREAQLQRTARLYEYALGKTGQEVPSHVKKTAKNYYASVDYVKPLCDLLRKMHKTKRDKLVYNAKDKLARDLADWWEEHLEADAVRIKQEKLAAREKKIRDGALKKLSAAERRVLGIR